MNFIKALIAVSIIAIIFFFVGKSCSKETTEPDHTRELELQAERDSIANHSLGLQELVKDLYTRLDNIKPQIVYREREIDEKIAKDSSNAIVEYRKALQDNDWLPESNPQLTLREVGIGAKLMAKVPRLELTINLQDSIIFNKDLIISDKDYTIGGYKETVEIKNKSITYWQELYEDESSFWNSNGLWLGVGVVGTVAIIFLTGLAK